MAHIRNSAARSVLAGRRRRASSAKRIKNKLVSDKIKVLRAEGMPEKQSVAVALNMERAGRLRPGGIYVRAKKK